MTDNPTPQEHQPDLTTMEDHELNSTQELIVAIRKTMDDFAAAIEPTIYLIKEARREVNEAMEAAYNAAGHPYGPMPWGLERWVRETPEAHQLELNAMEITQYHALLTCMRDKLLAERAKQRDPTVSPIYYGQTFVKPCEQDENPT